MRKFDTKVQHLKYKVLREVARHAWNNTLLEQVLEIPKQIVPGNTPTMLRPMTKCPTDAMGHFIFTVALLDERKTDCYNK